MKHQSGLSLPELLFVLAFVAITALLAASSSTVWLQRESARSCVHELVSALQTTRVEAVGRNRPCRFVIDPASRSIELWDGEGTASPADDRSIRRASLPTAVSFAGPAPGPAVTLRPLDDGRFETVYDADGSVVAGDGSIVLRGGGDFHRLSVLAAGGVRVERWNGEAWVR